MLKKLITRKMTLVQALQYVGVAIVVIAVPLAVLANPSSTVMGLLGITLFLVGDAIKALKS